LLYLVVGIAAALMALLLCFVPQLLHLIYGHIEADVFAHAKAYFYWTLPGYPLYAAGLTCAALLRSMALNKQAVILTASVNLLNVAGNAILIYGFGLGAAGAAMSTTLSRLIFAVAGLLMLHNRKHPIYFENLLNFRIDFSMMKRLFGVGVTNSLQGSLFHLGKLTVSSLVATFGTIAIAANAVANSILNIGWTLTSSFGTVLLTVVGHCIGAGEVAQAKHYTKKMLIAASVVTYTIFTGVFLLREHLVLLFDFEPEALAASAYYVGVGALLTMVSVYSLAFVPLSAFRAAGDLKYPLFLSVGSMFIFRVGLSYLLASAFHMGLMSVWLGFFADWVCHSILNAIRLRNGKWIHEKLI
jgi:putative MATE family efflux protein